MKLQNLHGACDRFKLGMYQAHKYFAFLFDPKYGLVEDIEQCVKLAVFVSDGRSNREFGNAVNGELYHLARAHGWRKKWMFEDTSNGWWERKMYQFSEIDRRVRL